MAELAKNSVRCSSFENIIKEYYVGENHDKLYKTISKFLKLYIFRLSRKK